MASCSHGARVSTDLSLLMPVLAEVHRTGAIDENAQVNKTILLVDDDTNLTDNLEDILQAEGYVLYSAASCSEARQVMADRKPQTALLDLKLPDGSGTQLLTELKELHPGCIFSIMTGYADLDSALAALHQGAFQYLQKPLRPTELLALLDRVFENLRLREEKQQAEQRLQESEERFRTIFETAQDLVFIKNGALAYTHVSPSIVRTFSLPAEEFIGKTDEAVFGPDAAAVVLNSDLKALKGATAEEELTVSVHGTARTFHTIKVPMRDHAGQIIGIIGIARDISERKLLEAQLIHVQKMEAVGTLAGGIAHDFNNLLQAIMGCAELVLLGKQSTDPGVRELNDIVSASQRGAELTRQLLTFSRKIESKKEPLDINEIVERARRLLVRTIPRMIDIELLLQGNIERIHADPVQLEQVLMNLAVNARDAMPYGGKLFIETRSVVLGQEFCQKHLEVKPGKYQLLKVADSGHGMDDQTIQHIFEPFYTTKGVGRGTGLGLATVYGIVKNHDGYIFCHSAVGSGTVFEIYLPADDQILPSDTTPEEEGMDGGTETILLVDDDEFMRFFANTMLTRFGYTVIAAENGETALEIYRSMKGAVDLVILDLIMPGMGGRKCLEELILIDSDVKVLIASGYSPDWPEGDNREYPAKGFIAKPYEIRKMLATIRQVLTPTHEKA